MDEERGLTTDEMAEKLGISESTLRRTKRTGAMPKQRRDTAGRRMRSKGETPKLSLLHERFRKKSQASWSFR